MLSFTRIDDHEKMINDIENNMTYNERKLLISDMMKQEHMKKFISFSSGDRDGSIGYVFRFNLDKLDEKSIKYLKRFTGRAKFRKKKN